MNSLPTLNEPLKLGVIGAGQRSRTIYQPLFDALKPWVKVVGVCDPVREHADALAGPLNVPAFCDLRHFINAGVMEAALVVTPVESHHALSITLSRAGVHNMTETSWTNTIRQARWMIDEAKQHGVIVRVAENFFRFPIDRIVQKLMAANTVGRVHRIVSYADHTGYHNNSRWLRFAGAHPTSVQAIEHTMPTAVFDSTPQRHHDSETYRARVFAFPDNLLVLDHCANAKGFLGRHPRPGYTEWQGERGTIVWYAASPWRGEGEVRFCSDNDLAAGPGTKHQRWPVVHEFADRKWQRSYVETDHGVVEHVNPFMPRELPPHADDAYGCAIMDHLVDFALAVRGVRDSEFNEQDALMSTMMEVAAAQSVMAESRRIALPIDQTVAADRQRLEAVKVKFGVDPLNIEAMIAIAYPKP